MKRVPTADRVERNTAFIHAADGKAGSEKKEDGVTAGGDGSAKLAFKKIKLSSRKESSKAEKLNSPRAEQDALISPVSSPVRQSTNAGQTPPSLAFSAWKPTTSMPQLLGAGSKPPAPPAPSNPAPTHMPVTQPSGQAKPAMEPAHASNDDRRQQWQQRDQPSFIFDEITDPSLLRLFDTAGPGSQTAQAPPQPSERDQARQLQPIAAAIKEAIEGVLADVMKQFMTAVKGENGAKQELYKAFNAFSEMMQVFNRAKIAAIDGKEVEMQAELRTIRSTLEKFLRLGFTDVTQHFSIEKHEKDGLKKGLQGLLALCRQWLHEKGEEHVRPCSPSLAPSSPETRQRAISSPVRSSEPWVRTEDSKTSKPSLHLSMQLSPRASQHRIGPASPGAAATPSPTSTPPGSPLTSLGVSPVSSPVASPRESSKSFRLSALIGATLSPRSRDAGRRESPVKGQARKSLQIAPGTISESLHQQSDKTATQDKATIQNNNETLH